MSGYSKCRPSIPERHSQEAYFGMFSLEIKVAEVLGEPVHVLADFIVGDSCVDLRCLHVGVAEHLAHSLDGHSLAERHGRGEGMASCMEYTRRSKQ